MAFILMRERTKLQYIRKCKTLRTGIQCYELVNALVSRVSCGRHLGQTSFPEQQKRCETLPVAFLDLIGKIPSRLRNPQKCPRCAQGGLQDHRNSNIALPENILSDSKDCSIFLILLPKTSQIRSSSVKSITNFFSPTAYLIIF